VIKKVVIFNLFKEINQNGVWKKKVKGYLFKERIGKNGKTKVEYETK